MFSGRGGVVSGMAQSRSRRWSLVARLAGWTLLEDAVANLRCGFDRRVDRVNDAYEDKMLGGCQVGYDPQNALLIWFAGHLKIKPADVELE